jgi:hypothetical protein
VPSRSWPTQSLPQRIRLDGEKRGHGFCDEGQRGADSRVGERGWDAYPVHQAHGLVCHGHGGDVVAEPACTLAALDHRDE